MEQSTSVTHALVGTLQLVIVSSLSCMHYAVLQLMQGPR